MNVLYVDDEVELARLVCERLEEAGLRVFRADSISQALEFYRGHPVSIIFSDDRMPGGRGLDLLKSIREEGGKEPFYLLTGIISHSREEAESLGLNGVFEKPFDPQELIDLVGELK